VNTTPRPAPRWRKSSHSGGDESACVEVAALPGAVAVRDSKDPGGPALAFPRATFRTLITTIKADPR
jgi:hypothetical protein